MISEQLVKVTLGLFTVASTSEAVLPQKLDRALTLIEDFFFKLCPVNAEYSFKLAVLFVFHEGFNNADGDALLGNHVFQ